MLSVLFQRRGGSESRSMDFILDISGTEGHVHHVSASSTGHNSVDLVTQQRLDTVHDMAYSADAKNGRIAPGG